MKLFIALFITFLTIWGVSHTDIHCAESFKKQNESVVKTELPDSHADDLNHHNADTCADCHMGHHPFPISSFNFGFKESFKNSFFRSTKEFVLSNFALSLLRPPIAAIA